MIYIFGNIAVVPPIYESYEHKKKFPSVLSAVVLGVVLLDIFLGATWYASYGASVGDVAVANL